MYTEDIIPDRVSSTLSVHSLDQHRLHQTSETWPETQPCLRGELQGPRGWVEMDLSGLGP